MHFFSANFQKVKMIKDESYYICEFGKKGVSFVEINSDRLAALCYTKHMRYFNNLRFAYASSHPSRLYLDWMRVSFFHPRPIVCCDLPLALLRLALPGHISNCRVFTQTLGLLASMRVRLVH